MNFKRLLAFLIIISLPTSQINSFELFKEPTREQIDAQKIYHKNREDLVNGESFVAKVHKALKTTAYKAAVKAQEEIDTTKNQKKIDDKILKNLIDNNQLRLLSKDEIKTLTPEQIKKIPTDQIHSLNIESLDSQQIKSLTIDQIKNLSLQQILKLSKEQTDELNPEQLTTIANILKQRHGPITLKWARTINNPTIKNLIGENEVSLQKEQALINEINRTNTLNDTIEKVISFIQTNNDMSKQTIDQIAQKIKQYKSITSDLKNLKNRYQDNPILKKILREVDIETNYMRYNNDEVFANRQDIESDLKDMSQKDLERIADGADSDLLKKWAKRELEKRFNIPKNESFFPNIFTENQQREKTKEEEVRITNTIIATKSEENIARGSNNTFNKDQLYPLEELGTLSNDNLETIKEYAQLDIFKKTAELLLEVIKNPNKFNNKMINEKIKELLNIQDMNKDFYDKNAQTKEKLRSYMDSIKKAIELKQKELAIKNELNQ